MSNQIKHWTFLEFLGLHIIWKITWQVLIKRQHHFHCCHCLLTMPSIYINLNHSIPQQNITFRKLWHDTHRCDTKCIVWGNNSNGRKLRRITLTPQSRKPTLKYDTFSNHKNVSIALERHLLIYIDICEFLAKDIENIFMMMMPSDCLATNQLPGY